MVDGKEREAEKRKLGQNDNVAVGPQKKPRKDNGDVMGTTNEEVDEFFVILRRINVAVNYFKKSNGEGEGRKVREGVTALEMELESCTNVENNGVKDGTTRVAEEDGQQQNVGLDLNTDPVTDP